MCTVVCVQLQIQDFEMGGLISALVIATAYMCMCAWREVNRSFYVNFFVIVAALKKISVLSG